jgi:NAD(P)-dependent dehydrogenase (short-subunit alcohol dehydrogenase family)
MELKNKVALVTGGASGLGQATVETFVEKEQKWLFLILTKIMQTK